MRRRVLIISGLLGIILGATVAFVGATRIFVCVEPSYVAVCASENPILAIAWGVPIGLAAGLLAGLLISKRLSSN